jgi:hypothetical protein
MKPGAKQVVKELALLSLLAAVGGCAAILRGNTNFVIAFVALFSASFILLIREQVGRPPND